MSTIPNSSLLLERGEVVDFDTFYRGEYSGMVAIARALTRDNAVAEDLAQESFVTAHRHWERISGYDDPRAWVRRVLINRATSFLRRRGVELRAMRRVSAETVSTMPELSVDCDEVWTEVRRLPRRQAQAIVLLYVGELSIEEIAETMGCSQGAVKSHLHRARSRLGRALAGFAEEES